MEYARGQIRLRWIITCGTCGDDQEFYGLNKSGSQLALRAGWQYTLSRGYRCSKCSAPESVINIVDALAAKAA